MIYSLSFTDKQALLRIYMNKGFNFQEAKEMVNKLNQKQIQMGKEMKLKQKSESEIKQKLQNKFEKEFQKLCFNEK